MGLKVSPSRKLSHKCKPTIHCSSDSQQQYYIYNQRGFLSHFMHALRLTERRSNYMVTKQGKCWRSLISVPTKHIRISRVFKADLQMHLFKAQLQEMENEIVWTFCTYFERDFLWNPLFKILDNQLETDQKQVSIGLPLI